MIERVDASPGLPWTKVIRPRRAWLDIDLKRLWSYRDLILLLVRRDFVTFYQQSVLGPFWFLLQPLLTTVVFTVIFGKIARIPTDGIPQVLFYLCGVVVWNYFSSCLTGTADTFVANANLFSKVYFPRLTIPISIVITNLITFIIQFALFLVFLAYFSLAGTPVKVTWWMLLTPALLVQMAALGLGLGILISSLTTKYRDLKYVIGFAVQLWMYLTPIVYPLSEIPERWQGLALLNPMTGIVEMMRYAFLGAGVLRLGALGVSLATTTLVLGGGIVLFSRIEKTFIDTV